jgi:mRNA-degrading endonuclease toxin of MazEF toxin-antitoxin module
MQNITPKKIQKGDIYLVENTSAIGHIQKGIRPHVVVTQVTGETVTVAPCTSKKKLNRKYVVEILPTADNGLDVISYILLSQSFAADISLLQKKIGHLEQNEITLIQLEYVKYVTD